MAAKSEKLKKAGASIKSTGKVSETIISCPVKKVEDWQCVKYKKLRGPKYYGIKQNLKDFKDWDAFNDLTESDKKIIKSMSPNEGAFNDVQAYDNQAITVGSMQKTVNGSGDGEFKNQIIDFKESNPDKYKSLFEDNGWTVEEVTEEKEVGKGKKKKTIKVTKTELKYTYYEVKSENGVEISEKKEIKGKELYNFIKSFCNSATDENKKNEIKKALDALRKAGEDSDFQKQQISDFKTRLNSSISKKPQGYKYPISDYMNSDLGKAVVLDQDVNRPGYVSKDFGKALDNFYKKNPNADKDPSKWKDEDRSKYETEIIDDYGKNRRGTDMSNRYDKIKKEIDTTL